MQKNSTVKGFFPDRTVLGFSVLFYYTLHIIANSLLFINEWYFSVVDMISVLTDQATPRRASTYWAVLKKRLKDEGNETVTNCNGLKMTAADGKKALQMLPIPNRFYELFSPYPHLKPSV